jgi:CO/xanthine dehydrogenase FAD-binding subunit
MSSATFLAPESVAEATAALAVEQPPRIISGGTDVMTAQRAGTEDAPQAWLSLHRIEELRGIRLDAGGTLWLGACVTHAELEGDPQVLATAPAVVDAARIVGGAATRTLGTIGGNIVRASPAMDLGAPLLVHDAHLMLAQAGSYRRVAALGDFLKGPGATDLRSGELLVAVMVPRPKPGEITGSAYVRLGSRSEMDVAVVGAAARLILNEDRSTVMRAAIAISAAAPTCVRAPAAEALLTGAAVGGQTWAAAGQQALLDVAPIGDLRAPLGYRRAMVAVAVRRALAVACDRATQAGAR